MAISETPKGLAVPRRTRITPPAASKHRYKAGGIELSAVSNQSTGASNTSGFNPIKPRRISEEICEQVRLQIANGDLKSGDRLPSERELAGFFSVSRMAVREGMRNLEIAGLIVMRKGRNGGAFVSDNSVKLLTQSFNDMIDLGRASLDMLMEVRLHVMDAVVRLACDRATDVDFVALEENIDLTQQLTAAGKFEERTFTAIQFNGLLAQATGNIIFQAIVESLSVILRRSVALAGVRMHDPVIESRRKLLDQLRKRKKADAMATMRTYLEGLHGHLTSSQKELLLQGRRTPPSSGASPGTGFGRAGAAEPKGQVLGRKKPRQV